MKIRPLTETVQSFQRVSDKQDNSEFSDLGSDQQAPDRKDKQKEQGPEITPSFDEVNAAIESFVADKQARESGLTAMASGSRPGLKILL